MTANAPTHAPVRPIFRTPVKTAANATSNVIPRPTRMRIQGRQTILRSVHSEWIKFWTLRSTWITSFIAIALTALFGAGFAAALGQTDHFQEVAKDAIIYGLTFGQIVVAVLGALIITGEYSSGQIRSSLAATPKRGRLLLSKAVVLTIVAFILGSMSVFLSWAISKPFLGEHAGSLTDSHYAGYIWGSGLSFAGIALMTLGISFLLRSTAGAITVVVSLLFVLEIPLRLAAGQWSWVDKIIGCLPSTVYSAVADPLQVASQWGGEGARFLTHGQAVAVFAAWAIIPLIVAWFVFTRRDA